MQWLALLLALVKCFASLMSYLQSRNMITAGEALTVASALKEQSALIENAKKVRADTHTANTHVPANVSLPNDGYRRD